MIHHSKEHISTAAVQLLHVLLNSNLALHGMLIHGNPFMVSLTHSLYPNVASRVTLEHMQQICVVNHLVELLLLLCASISQ